MKMKILKRKQIIVALDFNSIQEANSIVNLLDPEIYRLKIGKQLFAGEGPKIIENFNKQGFDIFLDLKLHDIPNTVYKALKNLLSHKIWMINIHLLGGEEMIKAAKDAWVEYANARTMLSYSENEATIAKELLTIAQKERAADQTDAAAVLAAEEALEGALKDLSDDSMSLLTTVYEILDVINLLEPDMVEDTTRVGTFNTSS